MTSRVASLRWTGACLVVAWATIACAMPACAETPALAQAARLYRQADWALAAEAFGRIAEQATDSVSRSAAQFYEGECLVQTGDYAAARLRFQSVLKNTSDAKHAAYALFRVGETSWMIGETQEARRHLEAYLHRYPDGPLASKAEILLMEIADRSTTPRANSPNGELTEAARLQRDGRHDAALAAYHRLIESTSPEHASDSGNPDNRAVRLTALRRAGQLHQQLGQHAEATRLYELLLEESPAEDDAVAVALLGLGEMARIDGPPPLAAEYFDKVRSKFPQSTQAHEATYWLAFDAAETKDSVKTRELAAGARCPIDRARAD